MRRLPRGRHGGEPRLRSLRGRVLRLSSARGGQGIGTGLRHEQSRVGNLDGCHIGGRHDHPHPRPGQVEQACGEVVWQADAAMRCRKSWQRAAVERDPGPGDALHMRHVRIVIKVGVVLRLLLNDAENAGRRLASFLAARHGRAQDPTSGVVDGDPLVAQRDDSHDRLAGNTRLDRLDRALHPSGSGGCMISRQHQCRPAGNDKLREPQHCLLVLRVYATRRHALPSVWLGRAIADVGTAKWRYKDRESAATMRRW